MNRDDTCLWARWQPVYRRHELNTGFGMERESFVLDEKGNDKWQKPRGRIPMPERGSGLLIVAMKLLVMGVEPRGSVIRLMNVANPLCGDEMGGGLPKPACRSRLQTAPVLLRSKGVVVNDRGKRRPIRASG